MTLLPLAPALRGERAGYVLLAVFGAVLVATLIQARLWPARQLAGVFAVLGAVALVCAVTPSRAGLASPPLARLR